MVQVEAADAGRALADAARATAWPRAPSGAGTGMMCFGFKGGIGTSSRVAGGRDGRRARAGELRRARASCASTACRSGACSAARRATPAPATPAGSCIAVVATDAPLRAAQLERVARRAGLGLARTGSVAHHGSGEIFLAFSTARGAGALADDELDALFAATVDATEEAVVNALWSAERVVGREGRVAEALPHDEVVALLRAHRRL